MLETQRGRRNEGTVFHVSTAIYWNHEDDADLLSNIKQEYKDNELSLSKTIITLLRDGVKYRQRMADEDESVWVKKDTDPLLKRDLDELTDKINELRKELKEENGSS